VASSRGGYYSNKRAKAPGHFRYDEVEYGLFVRTKATKHRCSLIMELVLRMTELTRKQAGGVVISVCDDIKKMLAGNTRIFSKVTVVEALWILKIGHVPLTC